MTLPDFLHFLNQWCKSLGLLGKSSETKFILPKAFPLLIVMEHKCPAHHPRN